MQKNNKISKLLYVLALNGQIGHILGDEKMW